MDKVNIWLCASIVVEAGILIQSDSVSANAMKSMPGSAIA
jgi:hypothetical protein